MVKYDSATRIYIQDFLLVVKSNIFLIGVVFLGRYDTKVYIFNNIIR